MVQQMKSIEKLLRKAGEIQLQAPVLSDSASEMRQKQIEEQNEISKQKEEINRLLSELTQFISEKKYILAVALFHLLKLAHSDNQEVMSQLQKIR